METTRREFIQSSGLAAVGATLASSLAGTASARRSWVRPPSISTRSSRPLCATSVAAPRMRRRSALGETRKVAAILVSDVVGYSRLAGADEDRTLARLRALRSDPIDPTISVHHGRIVKRTGDGSIIEFRSVVDAVRCAMELQHAMVERNAGVALDKRIEFRIGIHLGDVVEESDGDLMGDGVNIAARLEGVAKPGAICLSEQAYWQVKVAGRSQGQGSRGRFAQKHRGAGARLCVGSWTGRGLWWSRDCVHDVAAKTFVAHRDRGGGDFRLRVPSLRSILSTGISLAGVKANSWPDIPGRPSKPTAASGGLI